MKTKSKMPYHIFAIALVLAGYLMNSVYQGLGDINAINQVYLSVNELWWIGLAGIVELIALVEK